VYYATLPLTRLPCPTKSEVIDKLMQAAVVILGMTIGHALATLFHVPGI